jgi:hypothetical protein
MLEEEGSVLNDALSHDLAHVDVVEGTLLVLALFFARCFLRNTFALGLLTLAFDD